MKKAPLYNPDNPLWRTKGKFKTKAQIYRLRLYTIFFGAVSLLAAFSWTLASTEAYQANKTAQEAKSGLTIDPRLALDYQKDVKVVTKEVTGRITYYGWTGNKMANGKYPKDGYVATSDRSIKLGSKVLIDGVTYEVGDRTNKRIHTQFKYPTFDIYSSYPEKTLLKMGTHTSKVSFIK